MAASCQHLQSLQVQLGCIRVAWADSIAVEVASNVHNLKEDIWQQVVNLLQGWVDLD